MTDTDHNKSRPGAATARRRPQFPYPGLRAFEDNEARIFFGRDRHIDEILERLASSHFVPVIGPSGCGKSSLIRAGVNPALRAGRFYDAGSRWRIATMRPENSPIWNLATVLCGLTTGEEEPTDYEEISRISTLLLGDPDGIEEFRQDSRLGADENILLVVDQFEELFNIESDAERAATEVFISIILNIFEEKFKRIHCIITMRTDNLGDCARYPGLADAINQTLYLTPNLTEEELREAVQLPAIRFGGEFEDGLIDRILQDMSHEVDQLPLMQHIMQRIWTSFDTTGDGAKIFTHDLYESYGCVANTVNHHAAELVEALEPRQREFVPVLFRQLTERRLGGAFQDVRRPSLFKDIAAVVAPSSAMDKNRLHSLVDHFRAPDALFLRPQVSERAVINDESRIDIVHECLIRKWDDLKEWVEQESKSVGELRDLDNHAQRFHAPRAASGTAASDDPRRRFSFAPGGRNLDKETTEELLRWRRREEPNAAWAGRYGISQSRFDQAMAFLDSSRSRHRRRKLVASASIATVLVGAFYFSQWFVEQQRVQQNRQVMAVSSLVAQTSRQISPDMTDGNLKLWFKQWNSDAISDFGAEDPKWKSWLAAQKSVQEGLLNLMLVPGKGRDTDLVFSGAELFDPKAQNKILGIDVHPDGKSWALLRRNGVQLIDETGKQIEGGKWDFFGGTGQLANPSAELLEGDDHIVAFHPDGEVLHVISDDRIIRRISMESGVMETVRIIDGDIVSSAISPDCSYMAVVRRVLSGEVGNYQVEIFDLLNNRKVGAFSTGPGYGKLSALSFDAASAKVLAVAFDDTHITLWRVPDGDAGVLFPAREFVSRADGIRKIQLSPDGRWLAAVTDFIGYLWNLEEIEPRNETAVPEPIEKVPVIGPQRTLRGYSVPIKLLQFVGGGELLTVRINGETLIWRYEEGLLSRRLVNVPSQPQYQTLSRSGRISFIDYSGAFRHRELWKKSDDRLEVRKLEGLATRMAISANGGIIATGFEDGSIELVSPFLKKDQQRIGFKPVAVVGRDKTEAGANGNVVIPDERVQRDIRQLSVSADGGTVVGLRNESANPEKVDWTLVTAKKRPGDDESYDTILTRSKDLGADIARIALSPDGQQLAVLFDISTALEKADGRAAQLLANQLAFFHFSGGAWAPVPKPPKLAVDMAICSIAYSPGGDKFAAGTVGGNLYVAGITEGKVASLEKPLHSFPGNSVASILFAKIRQTPVIASELIGSHAVHQPCRPSRRGQPGAPSKAGARDDLDRNVKIAVLREDGTPMPNRANAQSLLSPTLLFREMSYLPRTQNLLVTDVDIVGGMQVRFFDLLPADEADADIADTLRAEIDPSKFVDHSGLSKDGSNATGANDLFAAQFGCEPDGGTCWMISPTVLQNRMLVFAYRNLKEAAPPPPK